LLAAVLPPSLRVIPGVEGAEGGAGVEVEGPPRRIFVAELPREAPVSLSRFTLRSESGAGAGTGGGATAVGRGRDPGRGSEAK